MSAQDDIKESIDIEVRAILKIASSSRDIEKIEALIIFCQSKIEEINQLRYNGKFVSVRDRLSYYGFVRCVSRLKDRIKKVEYDKALRKERATNLRHQNAIVREKSANKALTQSFNLVFKQGMQTATQNLINSSKFKDKKEERELKERKEALQKNPEFSAAIKQLNKQEDQKIIDENYNAIFGVKQDTPLEEAKATVEVAQTVLTSDGSVTVDSLMKALRTYKE